VPRPFSQRFAKAMVQFLREFLTLFAPMLAVGIFLNAVAPLKYKNQIQRFFENPKWKLNTAVLAFVGNTFYRVFWEEIFSKRFFITSIGF
jgi:limonene-1,2-epoxide hydrolase